MKRLFLGRYLVGQRALLIATWIATLRLEPFRDIRINDFGLYRQYSDLLASGHVPYSGSFSLEYPPLSLLPMRLAQLLGDSRYELNFALLMLLCMLALQWAVNLLAGDGAGWAVALAPLLAGSVLRSHFDLFAAALATIALVFVLRDRHLEAGLLLGAGAMTKFYPVALLPVVLAWLLGRGCKRAAAVFGVSFVAVVIACSLPFLGGSYFDAYRFHLQRPTQIESVPATALFALGGSRITGTAERPNRFRSQALEGGSEPAVRSAFSLLLIIALLGVCFLTYRRPDEEQLILATTAMVLACVALGKVFSPQFVGWLVPLIALCWSRYRAVAGAIATAVVLTQIEFPSHYFDLVASRSNLVLLVGMRNLLIVMALVLLLHRLASAAWSSHEVGARAASTVSTDGPLTLKS